MERIGGIPVLNADHPSVTPLLKQRDLFLAGKNDPDINVVGYAGPGVTLGAFGGEFWHEMTNQGITDVVEAVGVSVGNCNWSYARAKQGGVILNAYKHLVRGPFIDFLRAEKIVDIDYLIDDVFHGAVDPRELLDVEAVRACPPGFWMATTEAETGRLRMLDIKDPSLDIFKALKASVAVPILYNRMIEINGLELADCISDMLPLDWIVDNLKPTDLILQVNDSARFVEHPYPPSYISIVERLLAMKFLSGHPGYRRAFLRRFINYRRQLGRLRHANDQAEVVVNGHKMRVGIVFSDVADGLAFSRNPRRVDTIATEGKQKAQLIFAR